jgi:hypothetical protein
VTTKRERAIPRLLLKLSDLYESKARHLRAAHDGIVGERVE